ncbi:tryptophan--tRNA ligase [bacterium]|nr:MAG: tryptophan--tRNA ligase [bacterium]QQR61529.1 MAG: tryptophan--tRNA ligase [bacterium]QQR62943.1 MAG: tryptophan--tRNA ligase [bacterium]
MRRRTVLTGDRPTGPLHVGHYVGSLKNRLLLQQDSDQFIMLADLQALTDHVDNPEKVRENVIEVLLDYLSIGIDPTQSTIFIQSLIPQIAELTVIYLNLVTVNRLKRNPTIKTEIDQKGMGTNVTAGFLMYPVHQAADITVVKANCVPVGADQLPIIEQTNEILHSFNRIYKVDLFEKVEALIPKIGYRLPGIDGKQKMSKSLNNAIFLSDSADSVLKKVMSMYTDPTHLRVQDPGKVEGNAVFTYLDVFDPDEHAVRDLKLQYQNGGLGDVTLKKRLADILNSFLDPIRARRALFEKDKEAVFKIALAGSEKVKEVAAGTMREVKEALKLVY